MFPQSHVLNSPGVAALLQGLATWSYLFFCGSRHFARESHGTGERAVFPNAPRERAGLCGRPVLATAALQRAWLSSGAPASVGSPATQHLL